MIPKISIPALFTTLTLYFAGPCTIGCSGLSKVQTEQDAQRASMFLDALNRGAQKSGFRGHANLVYNGKPAFRILGPGGEFDTGFLITVDADLNPAAAVDRSTIPAAVPAPASQPVVNTPAEHED